MDSKSASEWGTEVRDDGAIHAMGNGRMVVYGEGGHVCQLFGPPYSVPNLLGTEWQEEDGRRAQFRSERKSGTAVWLHALTDRDGSARGQAACFVHPQLDVFVCRFRLKERMRLTVQWPEGARGFVDEESEGRRAYTIQTSPAAPVFIYPYGEPSYLALAFAGDAIGQASVDDRALTLALGPGSGVIMIACGSTYPGAVEALRRAEAAGCEALQEDAEAWGRTFASRISYPASSTGDERVDRRIRDLCDSVAFLIKAQQSEDGGIMAGHLYPLAYVRDQYGACRGLLALGLYEEAKRNLLFRLGKWRRFGDLKNAESMGHDRIRHEHENDEVEITAYMILQAIDYAEASGDWGCLDELAPMLDWCWEAQVRHLAEGMLPFNGDETYVAGGFLPRSALNDGSMEATLLFLESGRRWADAAKARGRLSDKRLLNMEAVLERTERRFRANFARGDSFVTNNPARVAKAALPEFRRGVCEISRAIGWTRRTANGRYVSPAQWPGERLPPSDGDVYDIQSTLLLPSFLHSTVLTPEERRRGLEEAGLRFKRYGYLPTQEGQRRFVGYDAGLLLYGLAEADRLLAKEALEHLLAIADSADAWVEYYEAGAPQGCRCRPWESGINIAAIKYALERGVCGRE